MHTACIEYFCDKCGKPLGSVQVNSNSGGNMNGVPDDCKRVKNATLIKVFTGNKDNTFERVVNSGVDESIETLELCEACYNEFARKVHVAENMCLTSAKQRKCKPTTIIYYCGEKVTARRSM